MEERVALPPEGDRAGAGPCPSEHVVRAGGAGPPIWPRGAVEVVCEGVSAVMKSAALEGCSIGGFHSRWVERLRGGKPARTVRSLWVSGNLPVSWLDNTAFSEGLSDMSKCAQAAGRRHGRYRRDACP